MKSTYIFDSLNKFINNTIYRWNLLRSPKIYIHGISFRTTFAVVTLHHHGGTPFQTDNLVDQDIESSVIVGF